jgi:hypothetical protein
MTYALHLVAMLVRLTYLLHIEFGIEWIAL